MNIEDEVLFQRYHIIGYDTDHSGVCDGTASSDADDTGTDSGEGLRGDSPGYRNISDSC